MKVPLLEADQQKPLVLVVDDTPDILSLMMDVLGKDYRVKVAINGEKALKICRTGPKPDLVLLDILMPGMDGFEVCRKLKADQDTKDIRVIFLTSRNEIEDEKLGLELGAVDYISKPVSPPIVQARVKTHLSLKAAADFLIDKNTFLEQEVTKRTMEVQAIQEVTILALASLAETRDNDTGNHLRRTQNYIRTLGEFLSIQQDYAEFMKNINLDLLFNSAPLHDIGKVGIPDSILLKPGRLTDEEYLIMKKHSRLGWEAIDHAEKSLGNEVQFLQLAKDIALYHHEKWDGTGYPNGLKGMDIPVSARMMAVADVYDALISKRIYKKGMDHESAVAVIIEGRGTHFDPQIVDAFLEIHEEFRRIRDRFRDSSDN